MFEISYYKNRSTLKVHAVSSKGISIAHVLRGDINVGGGSWCGTYRVKPEWTSTCDAGVTGFVDAHICVDVSCEAHCQWSVAQMWNVHL